VNDTPMMKINARFLYLSGQALAQQSIVVLSLVDEGDTYAEWQRLPVTDLVSDPGIFDAFPVNYDSIRSAILDGLTDEVSRFAAVRGLQITSVDGDDQIDWTLAVKPVDRSDVQELETAIANLSRWLDGAPGGPWHAVRDDPEELGWFVHGEFGPLVTTGYVGNNDSKPTAHLIAALQRTARVQMGMLRRALRRVEESYPFTVWPPTVLDAIDLARALNAEAGPQGE
jgi:hypothetical protein